MADEEKAPSGVIAVFVDGLENTPGWVALSRKKQDALLEHTSHIQQNRQLQMLGEFGELMELHQVQQLLEGEDMKMLDYLKRVYPDRHFRTIQRKQEVFGQLVQSIPTSVMKRLTSIGVETLGRFDRIANAALGDIRNAVKELPALPASTDKAAEKYLEELDSKLLEHRHKKRMGKSVLARDEKMASKMAANALVSYMKSCGLATSAQKRAFLVRAVGWAMEMQAVAGEVTTGRLSIPGGVLIPRGRPRKTPRKEVA